MGEKVYKPIVKDGDHLIHSKDNPNRVRGLTRDENNKNPDIIEWEEVDVVELISNDSDTLPLDCAPPKELLSGNNVENQDSTGQNNPVVSFLAGLIGAGVAVGIIFGIPCLKNKLKRNKTNLDSITEQDNLDNTVPSCMQDDTAQESQANDDTMLLDHAFEQIYYDMSEEEVREHIMSLIGHMLGIANEIRILSNARIREDALSEEQRLESQKETERILVERVSLHLNRLLSNESLLLDSDTSRKISILTGGGIRINGEYIPVQARIIEQTLKELPIPEKYQQLENDSQPMNCLL